MTTFPPILRALIYTRVSEDRTGQARSVEEQEAECRAECTRRGWSISGVLVDNDRSASKYAKRRRSQWELVKQQLAAGSVDVLCTWEASRAGRDLAEYVKLRDLCVGAGVLLSYSGRVLDLSTSTDAFLGGLDALLAERESSQTSERILRTVRAAAASGRPHGRRVYGYRRIYHLDTGALAGQEPHPDEAPVVREIIDRVARGASLRGLAHELTERGLRTSTGSPWSATTVRRVARNLAYCGVRVHLGEQHVGGWPAIVDRSLVEAARSRTDGNHRDRMQPGSEVVHLLSGLLRCGRCGSKMFRGHDRNHVHVYTCRTREWIDPATGERFGMGHLSVRKEPVDELVSAVMTDYLARPDVSEAVRSAAPSNGTSAMSELLMLEQRLSDAVTTFTAGEITASTLGRIEADLLPRIDAARKAARRSTMSPTVADAIGTNFDELPLGVRREIINALVELTVLPGRPSRTFDPERVGFRWRDGNA